ncbi:Ubiquinone biosynthesis O-methyltransferase [uncultured archaeon]|nr:Ubiquinone biosynthesis O-methyltransferase [uncultured archaeon]
MTLYSDERMFPEEPDDWPLGSVYFWLKQHEEHVARYRFFAQYAKNKCVLDAGCGFGYGSVILSNNAKKVVGIDKSIQTLKHSTEKYDSKNIDYVASDVTCTPFENKTFDTIYAFEVIEHIKNDDDFLSEMKRLLKEDGFIFISTPNKKFSGYLDGVVNKFHFREYELDEFREKLRCYFSDVQIYSERYSKSYLIKESNFNAIKVMREKIINLEQQNIAKDFKIFELNKKINYLENEINNLTVKFDRLHIELIKKFLPKGFYNNKFFVNKQNHHVQNNIIEPNNRSPEIRQIEPLMSIAPLENEIVIDSKDPDKAFFFIAICRK